MKPYAAIEPIPAWNPKNARVASLIETPPKFRWAWFNKIVFEKGLVTFILDGEQAEPSAFCLAKEVLLTLEDDMMHPLDDNEISCISGLLQCVRCVTAITQSSISALDA